MFAKRTLEQSSQGNPISRYPNPQILLHYGIPSTASILAFDHIQHLLAIGTLDGRIKVIGGHGIEGLLISPKQLPFKYLEFLQNQGILVSVSNANEIQVWNLDERRVSSTFPWESNITAFSIITGTNFIYIGDEYGLLSVLKYDAAEGKLLCLPYLVTANSVAEAAGISWLNQHAIVGVLPCACSHGTRVLIAYLNGLIVLWDVSEDRAVHVRGQTDLQLKDGAADDHNDVTKDHLVDQGDKEISSLCWMTSDESVIAVGYVDGDILLWNLSVAASGGDPQAQRSSHNVVKLQLSSAERRLPVIVLHCHENSLHNSHRAQLFVYGGDQIGSEEVLAILSIDWSSGIETLKCIDRAYFPLNGSFADMVLLPNHGSVGHQHSASFFVLTSPGQLNFYEDACLPVLAYPMVISVAEPYMMVGKLVWVDAGEKLSRVLEKLSASQHYGRASVKWPLSGGVPNTISSAEDDSSKRLYIAGYQDGSVQIWDATFSILSLKFVIGSEVKGVTFAGLSEPVSALDFHPTTLKLAVGNESGLVCLFKLLGSSDELNLHFVTKTEHEVHQLDQGNGAQYTAVFSVLNSPVCTLQFLDSGNRLAAGFKCGRVAMLNISSLSVVFVTECVSVTSSPVVSLAVHSSTDIREVPESRCIDYNDKWVLFILTRDSHIGIVDANTGSSISSSALLEEDSAATAISMYLFEGGLPVSQAATENQSKPSSLVCLFCCENSLSLCSLESLNQGKCNSIKRVVLTKPCCWSTIFQMDEKECGLIALHCIGVIEIRSLPGLELVTEISLMSILRWNSKTSMCRTMSSTRCGEITVVNGFEFAILSLLAIQESLPCLHDKVHDADQRKKQGIVQGILGGIMKGFKGDKEARTSSIEQLEGIFSRSLEFTGETSDDPVAVELDIDEIEIDEAVTSSSSHMIRKDDQEDKERGKLFEGAAPRVRTPAEIIAKYRKGGGASEAASHAREKLVQRQEKLERLGRRTEELQSGAENFASMANELAKTMEKRKWWNI